MANREVTFRQDLVDNDIILSVKHLKQFFTSGYGASKFRNKAVHDISFDIKKGEVFGLVGESGCGKTTTGRSIIKLYDVTSGSVYFKGHRINAGTRWNEKEIKWKTIRTKREIKRLALEKNQKIRALKLEAKQRIENAVLDLIAQNLPELAKYKRELTKLTLTNKTLEAELERAKEKYEAELFEIKKANKSELKERSDDSQENNDAIIANINKTYAQKSAKLTASYTKASETLQTTLAKNRAEAAGFKTEIAKLEKTVSAALKAEINSGTKKLRAKEDAALAKAKSELEAEFVAAKRELEEQLAVIVKEQKEIIAQIKYDLKHIDKDVMNKMQMIFQDPIDSLNPRMTVEDIIQEGLQIQGHKNRKENSAKVVEALERVGLIAEYASRYPHEFSGGQRQRIGIARALIMKPELIIADEPISALDVSIRAQIINLLNDIREQDDLTILFIAHDLSVVKYFCDRIAVMYYGEIVELTTSEELFLHPLHPYTKALLSAIPKPDPLSEKTRERLIYNPFTDHDYSEDKPTLQEIRPGHFILANKAEMAKYEQEIAAIDAKIASKKGA